MTDRIKIDASGIRISKPGQDVNVANEGGLTLYPGMSTMTVVAQGTVTLAGGARTTINFANTFERLPYVILGASDGSPADRETYCAETAPPYNFVYIRNDVQGGAPSRTINFAVLIDNVFI